MRPKADILAEVREAAASGHREVQLLGQIVNHYDGAGRSRAAISPALLEAIHEVDGIERIRFASPHPRHFSPRFLDAMARLPKICRHLHLPVQSGSTRVLEAMRRRYTRESYLELVAQIRESLPDVALSTDMIVGFPGETDADFEDTLSLTAARPLSQHVLVQVLAAAEHARGQAAGRRCAGRGEDAADRRAAGAAARHPDGAERGAGRARRSTCWSTRRAAGATPSCPGGRRTNVVVNLPGPPAWIGRTVRVRVERAAAQRLGAGRRRPDTRVDGVASA